LRVPHREIGLSATHLSGRTEENPPLPVYDTSGPYTDPDVRIDLSRGLPDLRTEWIKQRGDTEILAGPSSEFARLRERDLLAYHLRFPSPFISRRARRAPVPAAIADVWLSIYVVADRKSAGSFPADRHPALQYCVFLLFLKNVLQPELQ
jgi:hypothetical protein